MLLLLTVKKIFIYHSQFILRLMKLQYLIYLMLLISLLQSMSLLYIIALFCLCLPNTQSLRVRKNLNSLSWAEYNQYHILLRLMFISPPNESEKGIFKQILVQKDEKTTIYPQSLYDVLFIMHSTSCEHRSEYFPYWHRTFMTKFELFLEQCHNYAIELSDNSTYIDKEAQRLLQVAHTNLLDPKLGQIRQYLVATVLDYKEAILSLPKDKDPKDFIAAHYWNVMDYKSKITYAKGFYRQSKLNNQNKTEFKRKEWDKGFENADHLIKLVYDQDGIYQINFKTRWYRNKILQALDQNEGFLSSFLDVPTRNEAEEIIKNSNFWSDPDSSSNYNQNIANWLIDGVPVISQTLLSYLNYKQKKRRYSTVFDTFKMQLNTFDDFDVNFIFGGLGNNFIKTDGNIGKVRNNLLPYSMYAKSLKTKPFDFLRRFCTNKGGSEYSIENSHNFMHSYQLRMISDALLSPANPIFFPYHSFFDIMLEFKIKMINQDNDASGQANSLFDAISGVEQFMNEDSTILQVNSNAMLKFINSKIKIQSSNKLSKQQDNFDRAFFLNFFIQTSVKNRNIPINLWKNTRIFSEIPENDFLLATNPKSGKVLTYYDAIIDKSKGRKKLRQIESFASVTYDIEMNNRSDPFISALYEVIDEVQSPYPQQKKPVLSLWIAFPSNQTQNKDFGVILKNKKGKVLQSRKIEPVFEEEKTEQTIINFEMLNPTNKYIKRLKKMSVKKGIILNYLKICPHFRPAQLFETEPTDERLKINYRIGRKKVKVVIKGTQKNEKVVLKVKYIEDNGRSSEKEVREYVIQSDEIQNSQIYGRKGFLIESIIGISGQPRKRSIEYEFCLFSQYSELLLNFQQPRKEAILKAE